MCTCVCIHIYICCLMQLPYIFRRFVHRFRKTMFFPDRATISVTIPATICLCMDLTHTSIQEKLSQFLSGVFTDVLLSGIINGHARSALREFTHDIFEPSSPSVAAQRSVSLSASQVMFVAAVQEGKNQTRDWAKAWKDHSKEATCPLPAKKRNTPSLESKILFFSANRPCVFSIYEPPCPHRMVYWHIGNKTIIGV